jgi:hypothetical protein
MVLRLGKTPCIGPAFGIAHAIPAWLAHAAIRQCFGRGRLSTIGGEGCRKTFDFGQLVRVQADLLDEEFANAIVLVHAASLPDWMLRVLAIVAIMERIVADLV